MSGGDRRELDLEERTYQSVKRVRAFVRTLTKTISSIEDVKQVVRSSGSGGANYIEANEVLSKKDFRMRIKISRKESKEIRYWLRLLYTADDPTMDSEREILVQGSTDLMQFFGSILRKGGGCIVSDN